MKKQNLIFIIFSLGIFFGLTFQAQGAQTNLTIAKGEGNSVILNWQAVAGVTNYEILKSSTTSGWNASVSLTSPATLGAYSITVNSTAHLQKGDMLFSRYEYEIASISGNTINLVYPLRSDYVTGTAFTLMACWNVVYANPPYAKIGETALTSYTDVNLSAEKDYFYVIRYGTSTYSNMVNVKITSSGELLYDAALGSNGGYAWNARQTEGDLPRLIDGDDGTVEHRIQVGNPEAIATGTNSENLRGFTRINLDDSFDLKRIEIIQSNDTDKYRATKIKVRYDDGTIESYDLGVGEQIDGRTVNKVAVNKKSSYVVILVEDFIPKTERFLSWYKVGVYTNNQISNPLTSAQDLTGTDIKIDFSQNDGNIPTIFGTDEIYHNTEGNENGWMINTWPYAKNIFNLYRLQLGDSWPRAYGEDLIEIGKLAGDLNESGTSFTIIDDNFYTSKTTSGTSMKIGSELMRFTNFNNTTKTVNVSSRGDELTTKASYPAGTPVYIYKSAGQILRAQEILPEFKMEKIEYALGSVINPISPTAVSAQSLERYAVINNVRMNAGDFNEGDVLKIGREAFRVLGVVKNSGYQILSLRRGYDGTNQVYAQHNSLSVGADVYKLLDYEPYYQGFKNDPTNYANYYWNNLKTTLDKVVKDGEAIPWIIAYGPNYTTKSRGKISSLENIPSETTNYTGNNQNCVIVDEYNSTHDDGDWWNNIRSTNNINNDSVIAGNMYQYYHQEIHFLSGSAEGKVFYIRSHTGDRLRIVRTKGDTNHTVIAPNYVDLYAEGVRPGDLYIIEKDATGWPNPTPRFWQYNADYFYNVVKYIQENYNSNLNNQPFYVEYWIEPNLSTYGTWTKEAYIKSYNILANTIRNGREGLGSGFGKEKVEVGAGAIAGGLNPNNKVPGENPNTDYDLALSLIDQASVLDFVSHHRYYMGDRIQKRENSWEYWMIKSYAQSKGREIKIYDSEDSVATAGGTGSEVARHAAQYGATYWGSNFINSYSGEYERNGRLDMIIHFRLYHSSEEDLGLAVPPPSGVSGILDLVYWPIKMYQSHTSKNPKKPDILAKTIKGLDKYNWIQAMGTTHGETGERKIHLVNKKSTSVKVNLSLLGDSAQGGMMDSVIGGGANQTIEDGFHPLNYAGKDEKGTISQTAVKDFSDITLEPFSANIISLGTGNCFMVGDIDCDGEVKINDIQLAVNVFLGIEIDQTKKDRAGNMDGTAGISIMDIQKIVNLFLGIGN